MATPENLERSLRYLDDLTSEAPKSKLPKLAHFNDRTMRMSDSFTYAETKFKRNMYADLSLSLAIAPGELTGILDGSVTGRVRPPDKTSLCRDFKDVLSANGNSYQVFDALTGFIEVLSGAARLARGEDAVALEQEKDTWCLLLALYRDRAATRARNDEPPTDERELADSLYHQEARVRECQIIVDWLESLEARKEGPRVAHFTDKTVSWENTLHELQNGTALIGSSRPLVTGLDPDAPHREGRSLHDLDTEDEKRLLAEAFRAVRAGKLDAAQAACLHCGQAWRAAAIDGWRLYHDPNRKREPGSGAVPPEGNERRDVWKRCAWAVCEAPGDPCGRALIGALCGHLDSLRAVCVDYTDALWAHLRVSLDVSVEKCIRENSKKDRDPLPDKYWNGYFELEEIFHRLRATPELTAEACSPLRSLQEALCLDNSAAAVTAADKLSTIVDSMVDAADPAAARFAAHVVMVLRLLGKPAPDDAANEVIRNYVRVLVAEGDPELVAYYASMLHEDDQVAEYAQLCLKVEDDADKRRCIDTAVAEGLNGTAITFRVVELLWEKGESMREDETMAKWTTDADALKVSALDWLMLLPEQRSDALIETNLVLRGFILEGKLDVARTAYAKLPANSIQMIMEQYLNSTGESQVPITLDNAFKEYLCHKAYLDAQEGFTDWFKLLHMKPTAPAVQPARNDINSTVQDSRMREQMDAWRAALARVTKTAQRQLMNVLLFPRGGWMVDVSADDPRREMETAALRQQCIPEIVGLLHTLLHRSEMYAECLDLCTIVMNETRGIYKEFSKQRLRDFMEKMAQTSLALSDNMPYDFGIPPPPPTRKPLKID